MTVCCVSNLMLVWQWYFDIPVFPNLYFFCFYQWKLPFCSLLAPCFCFSVLFSSFWQFFYIVEKILNLRWRIQDGGSLDIIFYDVIITWYDVIIPCDTYQKIDFQTYLISSMFYCHCIFWKLQREGGGGWRICALRSQKI